MNSQVDVHGTQQRVSVVIPAYRAATTIRRAVDSVLAQTHPSAEVIVVDDGSPDDQAAVVQQTYGSAVTLLRQPNGGAASARNAGIARSTGDYIAFLDADDYWEPERLASHLSLFNQHPDLGLVAGAFYEELPGKPRPAQPIRPGPPSWYERPLKFGGLRAFRLATMIWTGAVSVRRKALSNERFESGLEPAEDRDLWIRIVTRYPAYLMARPVATAVLVEGSISRSSVERDKVNMLRVVERHKGILGALGTRVWRSYTLYRWAALDPSPRTALPRLLESFLLWPLPYFGLVESAHLGRLRRLASLAASAPVVESSGKP